MYKILYKFLKKIELNRIKKEIIQYNYIVNDKIIKILQELCNIKKSGSKYRLRECKIPIFSNQIRKI